MEKSLSYSDYNLFMDLYLKLLFFTNQKTKIEKNIADLHTFQDLDINIKYEIRNELYDNTQLFDDFINENPFKLNQDELSIINSWHLYYIKGAFFFLKSLKKYNIIYESSSRNVYGVCDLSEPLEDMFFEPLPLYIDAVLLPFKDVIIHDGMIMCNRISFGANFRGTLNNEYNEAKIKNGIITSLPFTKNAFNSDKEKLEHYLKDEKTRLYYENEINNIIRKNKDLKAVYYQYLGKKNSKLIVDFLIEYDINEGYFAIINDRIISSSVDKNELSKTIDKLVKPKDKGLVYIFQYKKPKKDSSQKK